ncbi:Fructose-bisphosphate aldolase class I [Liberibacter crescens BT-1]|uniref:Probable fructose-bisphosphate aldolase class 1 n=1 Tax=Liberibacter crescens (strain BT-1) TaxID=1215343 RepID=L0EX23_LIBCB|nr:class I fructose-bisphosphate aldolase [Liberibacter crescens]AGA65208.1 Fructose-bisphosphate aldolase class I [Liberibacter crescens BT-1]AMC13160.1 fructose-bisphosphate aldolase [Liberibacter crescens]
MREKLEKIAEIMVSAGKGILAADESNPTIQKRFDTIGLTATEMLRRDYREMLFSSKEAMKFISGVILYEETLSQKASDGTSFIDLLNSSGVLLGIKVDHGTKSFPFYPGELIVKGLDDLDERLKKYRDKGICFAKWRAVIFISDSLPSSAVVNANMHALARYAALCQENGIVPIVEPEVLMDGNHSIDRCNEVTEYVLRVLFNELSSMRVRFESLVLKPNMVMSGNKSKNSSVEEVVERTIKVLKNTVPSSVPGIAFLSGGQSEKKATEHLSAMNAIGNFPWKLTFSYGRALQESVLRVWHGKEENKEYAQHVFAHRARMNSLATMGCWRKELEESC